MKVDKIAIQKWRRLVLFWMRLENEWYNMNDEFWNNYLNRIKNNIKYHCQVT